MGHSSDLDILLLAPVPPPLGGISVHVERLVPILKAQGLRVGVLNHFGSSAQPYVVGSLNRNPLKYSLLPLRFSAAVVHYHHASWPQLVAVAASRAFKRRSTYMVTVHAGDMAKHFPQLISRNVLTRWITRWSLRRFDVIVLVSPVVLECFRHAAPHARIEVVPAFLPSPATAGYGDELDDFLASGSIVSAAAYGIQFLPDGTELYGLDTLVDAFVEVARERDDSKLLVFMAHPTSAAQQRTHLDSLVGRLRAQGLGLRVRFEVGRRLSPALRSTSVFVRPTRADGDALSVREAQAMGVPVIASDAVPRPDGVEVFRTGDVHDLANRMRAMMAVETSRTSRGDEDTTPFRDALLAVYRFALDRPR